MTRPLGPLGGIPIPDRAPDWRSPPDDPLPVDEDAAEAWADREADRGDHERDREMDR